VRDTNVIKMESNKRVSDDMVSTQGAGFASVQEWLTWERSGGKVDVALPKWLHECEVGVQVGCFAIEIGGSEKDCLQGFVRRHESSKWFFPIPLPLC
jgi:hypothetical protein